MFSSAVCTLIYPEIHDIFLLRNYPMEESRVVVVTLITTFIWIITTLATPNQSEIIRLKMMPVIENKKTFLRQFVFALSLGFLLLLLSSGIWYFLL